MNAAEQKFIEKWERTRSKGKFLFIAKMTLIFLIIFPLVHVFFNELIWQDEEGEMVSELIKNISTGALLGVFLGFANWRTNEKKHRHLKGDES